MAPRVAAMLAVACLACLGARPCVCAAGESATQPATPPADDLGIEWKNSWEETYEANRKRWENELRGLDADPRHEQMARRLTGLVRALITRYGSGGQGRPQAYERITQDMARLGSPARGIDCLKQLMAAFPGNRGLEVAALQAILRYVREANRWRDGGPYGATAEQAADRLIALDRAGRLNENREAAESAWRMRLALAMEDRRFWEAGRALDGLAGVTGRNADWYQMRVELLLSAGRWQDARRLLETDADQMEARFVEAQRKRFSKMAAVPPDFPRDLGLEMRWTAIHSRTSGADTATVQALLDASTQGQGIMPWEDDRHASTWVLLDRLLVRQTPQTLRPLRAAQAHPAKTFLDRAERPGDPQTVVNAYRRYPWAEATHKAMVACGEAALGRGASGLALRMFEDVLSHGADAGLRKRAQVGAWLAMLNETRDAAAIAAAFDGVAPDAEFPWMGGRATAGAIRKRLLEGLEAADAGPAALPPATFSHQVLRIPPVAPWRPEAFDALPGDALDAFPTPLGSLQASGHRLLLAGPNLLACFGQDPAKPLWWRTPNDIAMPPRPRRQGERGRNRPLLAVPGPFRPAMTGRYVYTRWGADPSGRSLRGVAALDARTGEVRWSTDEDPAWETMQPISDPAFADGRVYVLAIREQVGPILTVHLVCLDAERGPVLWRRTLGSQNPSLEQGEGHAFQRGEGAEQVRYGNAVTVRQGAVYCSTNLGFAARCDARDGMVEWVKPYARVGMGEAWRGVLRRQGAAPVVSGDRVIFMPRDCQGLFALDRRTGRLRWEAPLVPAEGLVGLADGLCVVRSDRGLFALETGSGRVVWHRRLPSAILGRPALVPGSLAVATRESLLVLRPATGETVEEKAWDKAEPPLAFVLRGRTLAGVSRDSAGLTPPEPGPAAPDRTPLAVPVKRVWHLPRTGLRLWAPPPEANVPGRLYLASGGVLECIRTGARNEPLWRRFAEPDLVDVAWADGTFILVCDRRLVALEAATGRRRWDCRLPFQASRRQAVGPDLLVTGFADERQREPMAGLMDRSTGRLFWTRRLPEAMSSFGQIGVARKGDRIHITSDGRRRGKWVHVALRADDGSPGAVTYLPADGQDRVRASAFGDEVGFYLTDSGSLYELALTDPASARLRATLEKFSSRAGVRMDLTGPWLRVVQFEGGQYRTQRQWIFRLGDPSYRLHLERYGEVRGDVNYTHEGPTLTVIDLHTRKETTYVVPVPREPQRFGGIFDFHRIRDRMWVASLRAVKAGEGPAALQLDTFDAATGAHLSTQGVPGVYPQANPYPAASADSVEAWRRRRGRIERPSDIVWTPRAIYVTDPRGLHALATIPGAEHDWGHRVLVARASEAVTIDGDLGEWDDQDAVPLQGEGGRRGRLCLTHDAGILYLAVRYDAPSFVPHVGSGDASSGDWLEIGLAAGAASHRWGLGADACGRVRRRTLTPNPLPEGLQCAVRHDPVAGELVYEVAVPLEALSRQQWDMSRMALSIAVWDEQPADGGPRRVLTWGSGVAGRRLLAAGHRGIRLQPLTQRARRAMEAIAGELPDLPEAFDYAKESFDLRATSAQGLLALVGEFLKRHPKSMTVKRLLAFDRALRLHGMTEPGKGLLDRAAAAGVPERIRRRYAGLSQAYLSQWVYVPGVRQYPRSISIELFDGMTLPRGWGHRVFWVKQGWAGEVPAVYLPERFPLSEWHEIRVPLVMLGMADLPICGIRYRQQGDPALVWDRTALVAGGKEHVFLDDALPPGAVASGEWRWVDDPVKRGTKAHTAAPPGERYRSTTHGFQDAKQPLMDHLKTPGGPYLSQWVQVDAKDPPRTVSLGLHDGRAWCFNAIWGEMAGRGRYMGPLPKPGTWQELKVPLAWTPLAAKPIVGLYFAQNGGRVVWDRTALVAGGKTHVVVDDQAPPSPAGPARRQWAPWAGDHVGGATVAPGKVGAALECDGWSGEVEVPHSPALEPAQMTIEAWIFLDRWPQSGDIRRWIVNKNTHEQTDGHYALVISGMQVGAYLNIGGKEGKFQAWSGEGRLTLRQWHHLAMTFDERDLKVYHNGRLAGSTPVNRKRSPGFTPLLIGGRQDGYCHFGGRIDEVRLYCRALSDREVLARYESGGAAPVPADPALVGHWGFDDQASPADLADGWQWVERPVKSGKRAHTQAGGSGYTGHCCLLRQPLVAHLPYDPARAVAVLERRLPALGPTDEAWAMFERLLQLQAGPADRARTCTWFLRKMPDHPKADDALAALLDAYKEAGTADPAAAVEADLGGLGLARETVYVFHRRHTHPGRHFVRSWQIVGPFPNPQGRGHNIAYLPETEGVDLGAAYDSTAGKVRWKAYTSPWEFVSLYAALAQGEPATGSADPQPLDFSTAYAVCWVHSAAAQPAVLQVGYNDTAKVWINRQLVLDGTTYAMQSRPEDGVPVDLPAGWSEVLVKTSNQQRTWEFYLELMDPLGLGLPQGVTFSTTPPAKAP